MPYSYLSKFLDKAMQVFTNIFQIYSFSKITF